MIRIPDELFHSAIISLCFEKEITENTGLQSLPHAPIFEQSLTGGAAPSGNKGLQGSKDTLLNLPQSELRSNSGSGCSH